MMRRVLGGVSRASGLNDFDTLENEGLVSAVFANASINLYLPLLTIFPVVPFYQVRYASNR